MVLIMHIGCCAFGPSLYAFDFDTTYEGRWLHLVHFHQLALGIVCHSTNYLSITHQVIDKQCLLPSDFLTQFFIENNVSVSIKADFISKIVSKLIKLQSVKLQFWRKSTWWNISVCLLTTSKKYMRTWTYIHV
jgi:hypothetical protein